MKGSQQSHGCLNKVHEAFLSNRDEALEDVEGS